MKLLPSRTTASQARKAHESRDYGTGAGAGSTACRIICSAIYGDTESPREPIG